MQYKGGCKSGGGFGTPTSVSPPSGVSDFSNFPPDILSCAKRILGEGFLEQLKSGQLSREKFSEAVKGCFVESGTLPTTGGTPTPIGGGGICPMMPTVDQCPDGQIKFEAFKSPECGVYYGCKPTDGGTYPMPTGEIYPYQPPPDQNYQQTYPSPYPTTDSGYIQTTEDPATRCAKEGGTWDSAANYCKFPQPSGGNILDIFKQLLFFWR